MKKTLLALVAAASLPVHADGLSITGSNIDAVCDSYATGISSIFQVERQQQNQFMSMMILSIKPVILEQRGTTNSKARSNIAVAVANIAGASDAMNHAKNRPEYSGLSEAQADKFGEAFKKNCLSNPQQYEAQINQIHGVVLNSG